MLAALDRHLKQNDSKISLAKDREFVKWRQVLYRGKKFEEIRDSGLFYLAISEKPKSEVWYKKQRIGGQ